MCGIVGVYNSSKLLGEEGFVMDLLKSMLSTIQHRGPDAEGLWCDGNNRCALGHRRLSIIDTTDAGRQPMASLDKRWWISFNGEIYNFQELRGRLVDAGIHPRGRTDTEILILGLQQWGVDFLPHIDGMFAFAAFDTQTGELLLARDAFGEKPLYYTELAAGTLAFASELQALESLPSFDDHVCLDAMAEVLMFQYIGSPRSIYKQVHKVLPGQWMKVSKEGKSVGSHFRFSPEPDAAHNRNDDDLADELEELLVSSLRRRLIADVPLGAFLSGGVDSSTVCALIRRRLHVPLKTFSMGFEGSQESEHETARAFAHHLGTEHYEKILTPDSSAFLRTIGSLLDEPNGDSSCLPTYLLSQFARQHVTVAISGDGGDELFAGYGRYLSTLNEFSSGDHSRGRLLGEAYYSDRILVASDPMIQALFGELPSGVALHLKMLRESITHNDLPVHARLRQTDTENYMPGAVLPKMDRMSMRHSLEVRTPFLNRELARFAEVLGERALYSNNVGKLLLRRVACRYLPPELVNMPKRGFAIPTSQWAPTELWALTRQMLFSEDSRLLQVFGAKRLEGFIGSEAHFSGPVVYRVWGLVMLESWCRHHRVTMPRLSAESRSRAPSSNEREKRTLFARQIAHHSFAAVVMNEHQADLATAVLEKALSQNELLCLAMSHSVEEITMDCSSTLDTSLQAFVLASGDPPSEWLFKGTLMLVDQLSLPQLGASDLYALRNSGVREVLSLAPYRTDGQVIRLTMRKPKRGIAELGRRILRRLSAVSARAVSALNQPASGHAYNLELPNYQLMQTTTPQTNVYHRFAVRVGRLQLPPLPVNSDDLAMFGDGRYYVFGRSLTFSIPRYAEKNVNVVVSNVEEKTDEFHVEILDAPLGSNEKSPVLDKTYSAFEYSVISMYGQGGSVIFIGKLQLEHLDLLNKVKITHCADIKEVTLITVTAVADELAVRLPRDLVTFCLDGSQIQEWLRFAPYLSRHRADLWPYGNECGPFPALLLGQLKKLSPRQIVIIGEPAHQYLHQLEAYGAL